MILFLLHHLYIYIVFPTWALLFLFAPLKLMIVYLSMHVPIEFNAFYDKHKNLFKREFSAA
jgi:hypothetical protein